jgi:hypothetical protein
LQSLGFGCYGCNYFCFPKNAKPFSLATMPIRSSIIIILAILFFSCGADKKPKIIYQKEDFWVTNFVNNNYSAKAFNDDKIYCSSLLITQDTSNRFYCFNLKSGKVDWAIPVKNWAAQPPIICDSFIYYCSYVGDIYKFDKQGKQLWYLAFPLILGGHSLNPNNNNLIVSTVAYGLREIDSKTGQIIDTIGNGKIGVPFPIFKDEKIFQIIIDSLFCQKFSDKSYLWKKQIGENVARLFLNKELLYYFDDTQRLYCLNNQTGELIWKSDPIFPKQPFYPHLEFEKGKILSYFSDLNEIFLIDMATGIIQEKTTASNLQKNLFLVPDTVRYYIKLDSTNTYEVSVINTLISAFDFRKEFEVVIEEKH